MKKIHLLAILIVSFLFSCKDFTDVGLPNDQITRVTVFKDDALALSAMSGVYRSVESSGFLSGGSSGTSVYLGCYTDELTSYASATADTSLFYLLTHQTDTPRMNSIWSATYKQIYYINAMIEGLQQSSQLSDKVKNQLLGESLFMRAILHHYLFNTFGEIPYITTTDYQQNKTVSRTDKELIFKNLESDLKNALEKLPDTYNKGFRVRPSKVSAKALLARVSQNQKKWDEVIKYSSEVISDPSYTMENNIDKTFLKESSSAIWQLMPYDNTYNTQQGNYFILRTAPPTTVSLSLDLVNDFENNDKRKTQWIGEKKDASGNTYFYSYKYKQQTNTTSILEYSIIFRVEEQFLLRAEAYIEKAQPSLALLDLNKIRNRVNLPSINNTDKTFLLEALLKERRTEFFTEWGQRFYDLKHFGKLDTKMILVKPNWKNHYQLLPIPEKELLLNPNLAPQNAGY